jgi:hypothetical protein
MEQGFYHPSFGYWQAIVQSSQKTRAAYPKGTIVVPLMPEPGYTFDGEKWVAPSQAWLDAEAAKSVRLERQRRLVREVDPIAANALRWGSLSPEKQAEWAAYRAALLAVPEQPGFPHSVFWPTKP